MPVLSEFDQYMQMMCKIESPLEALHYTSLLYLENKISRHTYVRLICYAFIDDHGMDWCDAEGHDRELTKLAERLTLRAETIHA